MIRVIKPEGFGNIQLEEVPVPEISARQVLVRNHTTLISRGSELFARYNQEQAVDAAIANLPETQRMAVVLRRYEELSYEEIAGALDQSVSAVKSLLFRARTELRESLKRYLSS